MRFSVLLVELPLASFFSILMTSFLVGLRVRQTLPVGPSIGVVAFFTSSGVRANKLNRGNFLSGFPRLHHLVKLDGRRV